MAKSSAAVIIGERLREVRQNHGPGGLTLEELSSLSSVSVSALSQYETAGASISAEALFRVARVLGIDLNYLARDVRKAQLATKE